MLRNEAFESSGITAVLGRANEPHAMTAQQSGTAPSHFRGVPFALLYPTIKICVPPLRSDYERQSYVPTYPTPSRTRSVALRCARCCRRNLAPEGVTSIVPTETVTVTVTVTVIVIVAVAATVTVAASDGGWRLCLLVQAKEGVWVSLG